MRVLAAAYLALVAATAVALALHPAARTAQGWAVLALSVFYVTLAAVADRWWRRRIAAD